MGCATPSIRGGVDARLRVAVLDDWQGVARASAEWSRLEAKAQVVVFAEPFADENAAAAQLADFDILILMRERTPFPASLIARLPKLKMIALTGGRSPSLDLEACTRHGVVVSNTGGTASVNGTAELALGLMLAASRRIPAGDAAIRAGRFQEGVGVGPVLAGKTLGIIGLGRIGRWVARYGRALACRCWPGAAISRGKRPPKEGRSWRRARRICSSRGRGKPARAALARVARADRGDGDRADEARRPAGQHVARRAGGPGGAACGLREGRIWPRSTSTRREPLPPDDPIRSAPNTVLAPHLGYATVDTFRQFYPESIENVLAFLLGKPIRVMNPEALKERSNTA